MPPPPATLPDELLEDIFLRLPPDEPACLVRASLASKLWLGHLTGAAFRGRYGEFHGAPPMLGFLLSFEENHRAPHFVSTAKFGARILDWRGRRYDTLDCRHGRVLLADTNSVGFTKLAVWDPMTGCRRELGTPFECCVAHGAAVLCAVTGCDHRACHQGPFQVLLFGFSTNGGVDLDGQRSAHLWVYSSETHDWSEPCSPLQLGSLYALIQQNPSLLFQNAIYHKILYPGRTAILKYDIGSNCMSLLDGPPFEGRWTARSAILMAMEDDGVGFTYLHSFTLYRWSRQIRSDGVATWSQRILVDLKDILPFRNPKNEFGLVGFKEGSDIIFLTTELGIYEINLKSLQWNKLWKRENFHALIPYMAFYNPPERVNPL